MTKKCLNFYLEPFKSQLLQNGEYPGEYQVEPMTTQVAHVYNKLRTPCVKCNNQPLHVPNESIAHVS